MMSRFLTQVTGEMGMLFVEVEMTRVETVFCLF